MYPDATEMFEEYSLISEEIDSRKIKIFKTTGKEEWITEIGESTFQAKNDGFMIIESSKNVLFYINYFSRNLLEKTQLKNSSSEYGI